MFDVKILEEVERMLEQAKANGVSSDPIVQAMVGICQFNDNQVKLQDLKEDMKKLQQNKLYEDIKKAFPDMESFLRNIKRVNHSIMINFDEYDLYKGLYFTPKNEQWQFRRDNFDSNKTRIQNFQKKVSRFLVKFQNKYKQTCYDWKDEKQLKKETEKQKRNEELFLMGIEDEFAKQLKEAEKKKRNEELFLMGIEDKYSKQLRKMWNEEKKSKKRREREDESEEEEEEDTGAEEEDEEEEEEVELGVGLKLAGMSSRKTPSREGSPRGLFISAKMRG